MQELCSDALAQDIEWYDAWPGKLRRELYSWNEKPNLSLDNFMELRKLRHAIDVPDNQERVERTSGLNAQMAHSMAGQF